MTEPLCRTCRYYEKSDVAFTEFHGVKQVKRQGRNYCREYYIEVEREASFCHKYDDKRNPDLHTMQKMAYIMEKKNAIGFDKPIFEFIKPEKK